MKKVIFGLSLLALTSAAFAGTNVNTPGNSESKSFQHEYYVIAKLNATTYQLSNTPPDEPCDGTLEPCRITTLADHSGNMVIQTSELNNTAQATIEDRQGGI